MATTCSTREPFALQVIGDSMAPEIPDAAIIIIDPEARATSGDYVVAQIGEQTELGQLLIVHGVWSLVTSDGIPGAGSIVAPDAVIGRVIRCTDAKRSFTRIYE